MSESRDQDLLKELKEIYEGSHGTDISSVALWLTKEKSRRDDAIFLIIQYYKAEWCQHLSVMEAERHLLEAERQLDKKLKHIEFCYSIYENFVRSHTDTLFRKRKQLIAADDYGIINKSRWTNELNYFIENIIEPKLGSDLPSYRRAALFHIIDSEIERFGETQIEDDDFYGSNPIEYENWCAGQLRKNGWMTRLTPPTGDQGVDIIAEKNGIKLALQCKYYSNPVGNTAVQEIFAGISFHGANYGAVVTNSTYTVSAKELANSSGIKLLHHSELAQFDINKVV